MAVPARCSNPPPARSKSCASRMILARHRRIPILLRRARPASPPRQSQLPPQPAFGPTLGVGVGYERDWFRVELRYDQLFNILPGPSVPAGSVGIGAAF